MEGQAIDSKWKLCGNVIVRRPYKMEQKTKLETLKGGPYKWSAGKEGKTNKILIDFFWF